MMRRTLIATTAILIAGAALAQQSSTGQSSGGPLVPRGPTETGSIAIPTERRATVRQRFVAPPVTTLRERVVVGATVPSDVVLTPVPEALVTEYPAFGTYWYFRWNDDVVLVDPSSRRVVQITD